MGIFLADTYPYTSFGLQNPSKIQMKGLCIWRKAPSIYALQKMLPTTRKGKAIMHYSVEGQGHKIR